MTIAVSGVTGRADAVACCAALATPALERVGAAVVVTVGAEPARPGLLASPQARLIERELAAAGFGDVHPVARGHLCIVAAPGEALDPISAVTRSAIDGAPVVASTEPSGLERWDRRLTLVRADLPAEREVMTLLADALEPSAGLLRIDKRGPGYIGGRRALTGIRPGRVPHARYQWLCRGL